MSYDVLDDCTRKPDPGDITAHVDKSVTAIMQMVELLTGDVRKRVVQSESKLVGLLKRLRSSIKRRITRDEQRTADVAQELLDRINSRIVEQRIRTGELATQLALGRPATEETSVVAEPETTRPDFMRLRPAIAPSPTLPDLNAPGETTTTGLGEAGSRVVSEAVATASAVADAVASLPLIGPEPTTIRPEETSVPATWQMPSVPVEGSCGFPIGGEIPDSIEDVLALRFGERDTAWLARAEQWYGLPMQALIASCNEEELERYIFNMVRNQILTGR